MLDSMFNVIGYIWLLADECKYLHAGKHLMYFQNCKSGGLGRVYEDSEEKEATDLIYNTTN